MTAEGRPKRLVRLDVARIVKAHVRALSLVIVAAAIGTFVFGERRVPGQVDDAMIFYRYARNLVEGNGLVFNVGERVEGFTSLSWVLLLAAGMAMGVKASLVAHVLDVTSSVLLLYLTYAYASTGIDKSRLWVAALAPWLVLATSSFGFWSTAGLEAPLYAACVSAALVASARARHGWATVAAALATLTRPEGVLIAALVLAVHVHRGGFRTAKTWRLPACYGAFLVLLTAFRLFYFRAPLPNTFYAKVGDVPWSWTLLYVLEFIDRIFLPIALPVLFALRHDRPLRAGGVWILIVTVFVVAVGADYFRHARFFLPALPALAALAMRGASAAADRSGWVARLTITSIPFAFVWYLWGVLPGCAAFVTAALFTGLWRANPGSPRWIAAASFAAIASGVVIHRARVTVPVSSTASGTNLVVFTRSSDIMRERIEMQRLTQMIQPTLDYLKRRRSEVRLVAAAGIGIIGYETRLPVLDLLGLTDATIARSKRNGSGMPLPGHQRSNADYVLSRTPDIIVIPPPGVGIPLPAVRELWDHPEFHRLYRWEPRIGLFLLRKQMVVATDGTGAH